MGVLALLLVAALLPFLAQDWKTWGTLSLISLVLAAAAGGAVASPGFLEGTVAVFVILVSAPAVIGRAVGLWAGTRLADLAAVPLYAALLMMPNFYDTHVTQRPPKARCDIFPVTLADTALDLPPHASIVVIDEPRETRIGFTTRQSMRKACRTVDYGKTRLPIHSVEFRFWGFRWACDPIENLPIQDDACPPDGEGAVSATLFAPGDPLAPRLQDGNRTTWRSETARCFPRGEDQLMCNALEDFEDIAPGLSARFAFTAAIGAELEALGKARTVVAETITALRAD